MPYATQTDLEREAGGKQKLIQLTDLNGTGEVDTTIVSDVIAEAESLVNSYLETRYAVPIADEDVSDIVRRVTAAEAVYVLRDRREALHPSHQSRHEERIEWLDNVRRGVISPGLDPRQLKSAQVSPEVGQREGKAFSLTRAKFGGWT